MNSASTSAEWAAPASSEQSHRRRFALLVAALALAVTSAVYWAWPTTTEYRELHDSYAFDVTDLSVLNGQADNIVFGRIIGAVSVDEEMGTTSFEVRVTDAIKGNLAGRQVVEQLGFTETEGKTHTTVQDPEQPLLRPGSEVLLTLGQEPDGRNIVMAGPRSVVVLGDQTNRRALRAERVAAARNAKPVRDATGRPVLPVKKGTVHDS